MVKKVIKITIVLLGIALGIGLISLIEYTGLASTVLEGKNIIYFYIAGGAGFGAIFLLLSSSIVDLILNISKKIENRILRTPTGDIFSGAIGLLLGFVAAYLINALLVNIPYVGMPLSLLSYILFGYLGASLGTKKKTDLSGILAKVEEANILSDRKGDTETTTNAVPKILDTSVIIDGRIYEVCQAGFLEGPIVIPEFVLKELQNIADSADDLKREKGRRGLDILNKIQKEMDIEVKISDKDFPDTPEVDLKLIKLAQEEKGKIVTTDYNLNKVSKVHGIDVLNVNELSNAVKPVSIPGEEMSIRVIKEGKGDKQGVAYLDDGTMIIVEDGKDRVGDNIDVIVTSVIQTPAGRMIFTKPKNK